jgi:hypothetical protein
MAVGIIRHTANMFAYCLFMIAYNIAKHLNRKLSTTETYVYCLLQNNG